MIVVNNQKEENVFSIFFKIIFKENKLKYRFLRNLVFAFLSAFLELLFVSIIYLLLNSYRQESPYSALNNSLIKYLDSFIKTQDYLTMDIALMTAFIAIVVGLMKYITYKQALNLSRELSVYCGHKAFISISKRELTDQRKRANSTTLERIKFADRLIGELSLPILFLIPTFINFTAVTIALIMTSGFIGISVISTIGFIYFSLAIFYKGFTRRVSKTRDSYLTQITQLISNYLSSIVEARMNNKEKIINDKYKNLERKSSLLSSKIGMAIYLPKISIETLVIVILCILIYISASNSSNSNISIEKIGIILTCLQRLLPLVNQLFSSFTVIKTNGFLLRRIHEESYDDINSSIPVRKTKKNYKYNKNNNHYKFSKKPILELKNCYFSYDNKGYVLENVSLEILESDFLNINGNSGVGKSTILNLISGLQSPNKGDLIINGKLLDYNKREEIINWRKKVAYVPQQVHIIESNIEENIALNYYDKNIQIDYKKINILRHLCCLEGKDLDRDSFTTKISEGGYSISGGQKQRIGIARSLYQPNKKILILDESLSGVEESCQKIILERIRKYFPKLAIILVTHNKQISKLAEKYIELKK